MTEKAVVQTPLQCPSLRVGHPGLSSSDQHVEDPNGLSSGCQASLQKKPSAKPLRFLWAQLAHLEAEAGPSADWASSLPNRSYRILEHERAHTPTHTSARLLQFIYCLLRCHQQWLTHELLKFSSPITQGRHPAATFASLTSNPLGPVLHASSSVEAGGPSFHTFFQCFPA